MKLFDFIFAARPLLHLPVWTVYLIALEAFSKTEPPLFTTGNLLTIIALNLLFAGAFYYNQVEDEESDRLNNKLGFLQRGYITRKGMLRAFYLPTIAALALSIYISLWLTGVTILLIALSIAYSHAKTRLKDKPMGGLIANMLAHGGLVSLAGYPVYARGVIDEKAIYLALYFYVTVGAIYLMTTIPDLEGDRATGKITMAVKQGPEKTITFAILLMILGIALGMQSEVSGLASLAGLSTGLFLWARLDISPKVVLLSCKLPLLLLTFWAGAAYPLYLLFVIALLIVTRIYYKRRFNMVYPKLT